MLNQDRLANTGQGRTYTIGFISTGFVGNALIFDPYCGGLLVGVFAATEEQDYSITLFTRMWESADVNRHWLDERKIDGMVLVAPSIHSDIVPSLRVAGTPMVAISADAQLIGIPTVDVDNDLGTALAVEHLLSLGHVRIAHLAGSLSQTSAFIRRDAFYRTIVSHGISLPDDYIVEAGYAHEAAYAHASRLLRGHNRPTAIFAANDHIAASTIRAARDLGISVPNQLSIVGYDDIPAAATNNPPLTTVRQPLDEMGRLGTNLLLQLIAGEPVEVCTHVLPPEFVVRASTAPPASD